MSAWLWFDKLRLRKCNAVSGLVIAARVRAVKGSLEHLSGAVPSCGRGIVERHACSARIMHTRT